MLAVIVATLVSAATADDAGENGWVTIAYDDVPDVTGATTTSVSSTTAVGIGSSTTSVDPRTTATAQEPRAVVARPVIRARRYTG